MATLVGQFHAMRRQDLGNPEGDRLTTQKRRPPDVPLSNLAGKTDPMTDAAAKPDATLGREIQAKIGLQLRTLYNDIVGEGVPDRFADLLNQLDKKNNDDKGSKA